MNFQSICLPTWATGQFVSSQKPGIEVLLRGGPEEVDINLVYLGRSVFWDTIPKAKKSGSEEVDINLVYLGRSVFWDTIPKAKKSGSMYEQEAVNEVNKHDSVHSDDSFRRHTRSMDHAKRPTPSPSPSPECPLKNHRCKCKKKPRIKIIKEGKFGIHHRRKSTNRKCTLCKESFRPARELSAHVKEKHKYKFLCKYQKCKSVGYASKNSADRHDWHHHSPCHICATCGKLFYEKYNLEAHINIHDSEKFFSCLYPSPKWSIIDT